jgi:hypothetical protein
LAFLLTWVFSSHNLPGQLPDPEIALHPHH